MALELASGVDFWVHSAQFFGLDPFKAVLGPCSRSERLPASGKPRNQGGVRSALPPPELMGFPEGGSGRIQKGPGVLLKDPGVLLKDSGVLFSLDFRPKPTPGTPLDRRGPPRTSIFHEKSAPQTNSKAMSRHPKDPARLPSGTQKAKTSQVQKS